MQVNSAQQLMYAAASMIEDGDLEGAEESLREAIALADVAHRFVERLQASCFLGELLAETGRETEAREQFEIVLAIADAIPEVVSDVEDEIEAARSYLGLHRA